MRIINVGILGLGTVGSGTANILQRNADEIARRLGAEIRVIMACVRDLEGDRACDCAGIELSDDPFAVISHPEIDIVVELIGGETLARQLILAAIEKGKHIVTANKALLALHGDEIFLAAQRQNVSVMFESSVAGGISIIKSIREGLAGNKIELVAGIINGTGNFILSEMRDKGRSFSDALAEAQQLGYAEADPTFDVEGIDASHKLAILASIAFGIPLSFDKVVTEGIAGLSLIDVAYAEEMGYRIKHLGIAKRTEDSVELRVHPTLIPEKRLIANVNGVMNAVLVKGDAVGNTLHYGAGAGAEPTASAVVADIIDIARATLSGTSYLVPYLSFQSEAIRPLQIKSADQFVSAYYLRLEVEDVAGIMSRMTGVFADAGISIEAIIQKEPRSTLAGKEQGVSVIFITQRTEEQALKRAVEKIRQMNEVRDEVVIIRVEQLD